MDYEAITNTLNSRYEYLGLPKLQTSLPYLRHRIIPNLLMHIIHCWF